MVLDDASATQRGEGTVWFIADVDGAFREYEWYGMCPVTPRSRNKARGPGIERYNERGSPLEVHISIDEKTDGWTRGQRIKHVFFLSLENRSFDHMLGFSGLEGTDAQTRKPTVIDGLCGSEANDYKGKSYPVQKGAARMMPLDPGHGFKDAVEQLGGEGAKYAKKQKRFPPIDNSGYVANYAKYAKKAGEADLGEIMRCYKPSELPVLTKLAKEFAVCDAWHSSIPGPTWPNRFFMMAGSSGGLDHHPSATQIKEWITTLDGGFAFEHGSLFDAIQATVKADYPTRIYRGNDGPVSGQLPMAAAVKGVAVGDLWCFNTAGGGLLAQGFKSNLDRGDFDTAFTFIEPSYGDIWPGEDYKGGRSQHPEADIAAGEDLIKQVYEAIRNSPLWYSSLLIVTWDEHGGFYDHVKPGKAVPPGDKPQQKGVNTYGFPFDVAGVRVPAVVVSPWIARNVVDHRTYDHASLPATVLRNFVGPNTSLTARDKHARDVLDLLTLRAPRQDAPKKLPNPPKAVEPAAIADASPAPELLSEEEGNLWGFVYAAARLDRQMRPEGELTAIRDRVAAISTRTEAAAYLEDVAARLNARAEGDAPRE